MTIFRKVFNAQMAARGNGDGETPAAAPKKSVPLHPAMHNPAQPGFPAPPPVAAPRATLDGRPGPAAPIDGPDAGTDADLPRSPAPRTDMTDTAPAPDTIVLRAAQAHDQILQSQAAPPRAMSAAAAPARDAAPGPTPPVPSLPDADPAPRPAGRTRTRILGFDRGATVADPLAKAAEAAPDQTFPTGWIVVVKGPGRGAFFPLFAGLATVGRGEDQAIRLDFGDTAISRQNHATLAFDPQDNRFFVAHGGKSNIIRLNGRPVLATESLTHGDVLQIGETTLRFAALCGPDFTWTDAPDA